MGKPDAAPVTLTSHQDEDEKGQIIAVWSPRGGTGKTVVAVNLAILLGVVARQPTVLVDANMDSGAACEYLLDQFGGSRWHTITHFMLDQATRARRDEVETRSDAAASRLPDRDGDETFRLVNDHLTLYRPNLWVMRGANTLWDLSPFKPEEGAAAMASLLDTLVQAARFVVVDLGLTSDNLAHLVALQRSSAILLILTPDAISSAQAYYHTQLLHYSALGIGANRYAPVLNRAADGLGINRQDIVDLLGLGGFAAIIPDGGKRVTRSINTQRPLVLYSPRNPVTRALVQLAARFYPPLADIWQNQEARP